MKNNMNIPRLPKAALAAAALLALLTGSAHANPVNWESAQFNNFIDNRFNWTTDTLPTGGVLGIIDNSFISPEVSLFNGDLSNYTIQQDAGVVSSSTRRWTLGTSWTLNGGTFTTIGRLNLGDVAASANLESINTLTINGGTFTGIDILGDAKSAAGSFVTLTDGSLTLSDANGIWMQNGALNLNVSGGTLDIDGFTFRNTSSKFTITGGNSEVGTGTVVLRDGGHVEFGLGAGTLLLNELPTFTNAGYFNFLEGSGGSLTIDGYTKTNYETWWTDTGNSNRLRYDGGNTGSFDDIFEVSGSTIALVPEPGTLALLAVSLTAMAIFRRRRTS